MVTFQTWFDDEELSLNLTKLNSTRVNFYTGAVLHCESFGGVETNGCLPVT